MLEAGWESRVKLLKGEGGKFCTALRPNLRDLGGGGVGGAELKIHKSKSRYSATKIQRS